MYLGMLFYVLFLASGYGRTLVRQEYHYNLELFREIRRFFEYRENLGTLPVLANLAGNVIAFMPFGWLLPQLDQRLDSIVTVILLNIQVSLAVEVLQLLSRTGSFDVDDIFLNTLGGAVGYAFYRLYRQWRKQRYG